MRDRCTFAPGDPVICRVEKCGPHPGPRAESIRPEEHGESYHYAVRKFWVVDQVMADGFIMVRTRRGKLHRIDPNNPNLWRARWWEKLLYAGQFPSPGGGQS